LALSYLIPGIQHIRRDDANARKRNDDASAIHVEITDFATRSSTPDAQLDSLATAFR
jgi:hypothetical protein